MAPGRETRGKPLPNYKEPDLRRVSNVEAGHQNASEYVLYNSNPSANAYSQSLVSRKATGSTKSYGKEDVTVKGNPKKGSLPLKNASRLLQNNPEAADAQGAEGDDEESDISEDPEDEATHTEVC